MKIRIWVISSRIPPSSCRWTLPLPRPACRNAHDVLAGLTAREAKVRNAFRYRYERKSHALEEVGKQFDVTRERIRQIEAEGAA